MKVYNTAEEFIRDEYNELEKPLESINIEGHHAAWMMEEYAKQKVEEAYRSMEMLYVPKTKTIFRNIE